MKKGAIVNKINLRTQSRNQSRTQSEQENLQDLNELNVILIGDQGVGKTQLMRVYSGKEFD